MLEWAKLPACQLAHARACSAFVRLDCPCLEPLKQQHQTGVGLHCRAQLQPHTQLQPLNDRPATSGSEPSGPCHVGHQAPLRAHGLQHCMLSSQIAARPPVNRHLHTQDHGPTAARPQHAAPSTNTGTLFMTTAAPLHPRAITTLTGRQSHVQRYGHMAPTAARPGAADTMQRPATSSGIQLHVCTTAWPHCCTPCVSTTSQSREVRSRRHTSIVLRLRSKVAAST